LIKRIFVLIIALLTSGTAMAAGGSDLHIMSSKTGTTVNVDRVLDDGKIVVSVLDSKDNPVFGLSSGDFTVTQSGRKAEIISALPLAESLDVPRNFVLVLDNSYSMKERRAVNSLLSGVDELLKVVRPIDHVQLVVFSNFKKTKIGGFVLGVQTFSSSDPAELKKFLRDAYTKGITGKTVLYDAMFAGLQLIDNAPDSEPKFMVVFSDGADLNSEFNDEDLLKAASMVGSFKAFAIDYMPSYSINDFLEQFTRWYHGQVWKARSDNNLVSIFQEVASKMEYYYVVSYRFPPTGKMTVFPSTIRVDEIRIAGSEPQTALDASKLTIRPVVDSVYGIASWKVSVSNANGIVTDLEGKGDPGPELSIPLPTDNLNALAAGGGLFVKMDVVDNKGQKLAVDSPQVGVEVSKTSAGLTVTPTALKFDRIDITGAGSETVLDTPELTLHPVVDSEYGIAGWRVSVANAAGTVASLEGKGTPAREIKVPLPTDNLDAIASGSDLTVRMDMQDMKGHRLAMETTPVKVTATKTMAGLTVSPSALTVEEIKTVDYSPLQNYIYFDKASSVIPDRYVRLTGVGERESFDEHNFRGALDKYYQVLNIIGKRLTNNPSATITLVGCNDNTGEERRNLSLSRDRAEAVRDYLQMVWNIAPERMTVEARDLPKTPSASRLEEGRAENRRVEILSDDNAILMPIQSNYFSYRIDTPSVTLQPALASPYGIASWKAIVSDGQAVLASLSGAGLPDSGITVPTADWNLEALSGSGDIAVNMELWDVKGRDMRLPVQQVTVNVIRSSQLLAKKEGMLVQEKYALILFDFDKATIGPENKDILNSIVARAKSIPQSRIEVVGHSDNIGKESYNIKLSEKRALAVYKMLKSAFEQDPGDRISYTGVGPNNPPYDNISPEGRSFNRTVTITLEYMSIE